MIYRFLKIYFVLLFYGITMISFSQKENRIRMIYHETVCPPFWVGYNHNKSTLTNLKELLKKDSIEIFSIKFTGKPYEVTCAGCQCPTGLNIEVVIYERDIERLRLLGLIPLEKILFKENRQ